MFTYSLKLLLIIGGRVLTFRAFELMLWPKNNIEDKFDQKDFDDSTFLDVNCKLRASKYAIGKKKGGNDWYVSENELKDIKGKFSAANLFLHLDENALSFRKIDSRPINGIW